MQADVCMSDPACHTDAAASFTFKDRHAERDKSLSHFPFPFQTHLSWINDAQTLVLISHPFCNLLWVRGKNVSLTVCLIMRSLNYSVYLFKHPSQILRCSFLSAALCWRGSLITSASCLSPHTAPVPTAHVHPQSYAHNSADFTEEFAPFRPTCWWRMMLLFIWQKTVFPREDIIQALAGGPVTPCHT